MRCADATTELGRDTKAVDRRGNRCRARSSVVLDCRLSDRTASVSCARPFPQVVDVQQPQTVTVESLSRSLVAVIAPSETDVLALYLAAYQRDPTIVDVHKGADDATGFGVQDVVVLAPCAVAVASEVLRFLGQQAVEMFAEQARMSAWSRVVAAVRRRGSAAPAAPVVNRSWSPAQLRQVWEVARKAALSRGASARQADDIANETVAVLAVVDD